MTAQRENLLLIVYMPALAAHDSRPVAAVRALEQVLPGLRMDWEISLPDGKLIRVPDRDAWLGEAAARGEFPMLCNGDESYPITIAGLGNPAGLSPGGRPLFDIHAHLPLDAAVSAAALGILGGIGEAAHAFWGQATPSAARNDIARQTSPVLGEMPQPPRGLPALKLSHDLRAPEIPYCLGWINFWSAAAARAIGFPDPSRDEELLTRAQQTASGGWVVPLTAEPLDLDKPSHLDALKRAYDRFPAIGGRSSS